MVKLGRGTLAALALAAACSGSTGSGGGDPPTRVDCAWLAGDNCWKAAAAAATACTDGTTGALDLATTTCSYDDGTTVKFDPEASLTASRALGADASWDFTIVSSTATTCARYVETGTGPTRTRALTTRLGTFSFGYTSDSVVLTCPDGSRFGIPLEVASSCQTSDFPGWHTRYCPAADETYCPIADTTTFMLYGAPPADDAVWRCH